jgi:hypothetical protein
MGCPMWSPAAGASFINGATVPVDGGRTVLTGEPGPA